MLTSAHDRLLQEIDALNRGVPLSAEEKETIGRIFIPYKQRKGETFISEGEVAGSLAFIVTGLYKSYYIDLKGNERIKHFAAENDYVCSFTSFITRKPSRYYVEAMEDTELLVISHEAYMGQLLKNLNMQSIALSYTERMYINKEQREASFLLDSARERYLQFMKEQPELTGRISQRQIASYLGITPESMSRIKRAENNEDQ